MKVWKKIILGIIAFFFIIIFPIALVWFSISGSILDADTYKPLIPTVAETLKGGLTSNNTPIQFDSETITAFEPTFEKWLDSMFGYLKGTSSTVDLTLPDDSVMKPILKKLLLNNMKIQNPQNLTQEQIDAMFEQYYPTIKQQLQTQLASINVQVTQQLSQFRDYVSLANLLGLIALIASIVLLILAIVIIWQTRSIMNWVGTYFIIGSAPLLLIALGLIFGLGSILQGVNLPQEAIVPATAMVTSIFTNLAIYSGIFTVIGIALLFVKYAFPKEQIEPTKK